MKICILTHIFPARSETFVREHVLGLAKRGYNVTVIARERGDEILQHELETLEEESIRLVYVGGIQSKAGFVKNVLSHLVRAPRVVLSMRDPQPWKRSALLTAAKYMAAVRGLEPDIVHIHFGSLAARLQHVARNRNSLPPMLVTWHGYEANALPNILGADIYHRLFSASYKHTVGSPFIYNRLCSLGANPEYIDIIPMGVDLNRFYYLERNTAPAGTAPLRVLSVGRLDEVKGHTFLIEAVARIVRHGTPVELKIVGDGPLRECLEKQVESAGLMDFVQLLGAKEPREVLDLMHWADLFALTGVTEKNGKVESQGVVFAEAQATGLPVVASDIGGVPDSLIDGETGLLCSPGDTQEIAEALLFFVRNRAELNRFGRRARQFVEERFSIESMLDRFEGLYEKMSSAHG